MRALLGAFALVATLAVATATPAAEPAPSAVSRRSYVDTRLGQMHVLHLAPPKPTTKPALVLIHETGLSGKTYIPFARKMAADRDVFLIDLPGYGGSDPVATPPSIDQYAEAVADGIGVFKPRGGPASVDVMGHHGGAAVATQLALNHPELVRSLICAGIAMDVHPAPGAPPYHRSDEAFPDAANRIAKRIGVISAEATAEGFNAEEASMIFVDALRSYTRRAFLYEASLAWPGTERFPQLHTPTLIMAFDDDLREHTFKAAKALPQAKLVDMAPLGPLLYFRGPDKIAAAVIAFLDRP